MHGTAQRIYTGIQYGLKFAACYCGYVAIAYLLTGGHVLDDLNVTLPAVLAVYVAGGSVAGAVVGLLIPLARLSRVGAVIVGMLGMAPVVTGVAISMDGLPPWQSDTREAVLAISVLLGGYGGFLLRSSLLRRAVREQQER